ncbi:phosphoenolpyruvate--protein phosphotransferase [Calothrix sp. PCC 6303]|uniref:phosphoenolpyruvate--protein phosphotransferase n=1 Tax=Calothrix sp. PCC 6303 TaxID=1170562 RepID=UPI0002A0293F|nr:phosphoenolpyruvate--protein phosphotransferase [Calothrix sp. PCC 6303]AFZ03924.1 phosphoenolpyruvate-protein phosphotransferase [Calothrix sp. PCC 6303]
MVGIVIVSHSRLLAEGVRELALQMVPDYISLAIAAGIDDVDDHQLGTDVLQVQAAIESVYGDGGVLVLMDLGSALMSAEMALELLPEEKRHNVYLCEAPLVEGAIAATISAAAGNDLSQVIAEARAALAAKGSQLGVVSSSLLIADKNQLPPVDDAPVLEIRLRVSNKLGLHARPAAKFVATAAKFESQVKVKNITRSTVFVRANSINQVTMLGVRHGHELAITASGTDAEAALAAMKELVESHFGEDETAIWQPGDGDTRPYRSSVTSDLRGISASPGVAIAPSVLYINTPLPRYQLPTAPLQQYHVENSENEWQRLQNTIQAAHQEIEILLSETSTQIGDNEAAIFDAHLLFLEDPLVLEALQQHIFVEHLNAVAAWQAVVDELANQYRTQEDMYLRARAADVMDVGQRVLRLLAGIAATSLSFTEPVILIATDLTPSDTAKLDPANVLGICTTSGSPTSHTAIIARSLGIPAVVGVPESLLQVADGTMVALDGETGNVWIEPDAEIIASLTTKREAWQSSQHQATINVHQLAISLDGRQIEVLANIGGVADAQIALGLGAEGVGLLRTEFLFLDRMAPPSESEQYEVYHAIAQIFPNQPVIIRTLDIGGDKPLPYLNLPQENNPFLGWRGIRFCLSRDELFKIQLRAILRASTSGKFKIMFPMISTVTELQAAKLIFREVQTELRQAKIPFDEKIDIGIMIEVPSAVVIADQLAPKVDFFSIGTNDLSQYVMACDRTNPQVADLADAFHPAVLRMVQQTIKAGHAAGIKIGMCGELASDPFAAPILLGLGLDDVSLNPQAIPNFKSAISHLTVPEAEAIAFEALNLDSAAKVRSLISTFSYL